MELFIQIRDGQPYEHPIHGDNFREAFPDVDVNNLPPEFARFERIACPNNTNPFEVMECTYQWVDGVVKDVWVPRPMTDSERAEKETTLTDNCNLYIRLETEGAQIKIANAQNDAVRQAWTSYLDALTSWRLVDFYNLNLPREPVLDENGNVLSVDSQGSAPNVIG